MERHLDTAVDEGQAANRVPPNCKVLAATEIESREGSLETKRFDEC